MMAKFGGSEGEEIDLPDGEREEATTGKRSFGTKDQNIVPRSKLIPKTPGEIVEAAARQRYPNMPD